MKKYYVNDDFGKQDEDPYTMAVTKETLPVILHELSLSSSIENMGSYAIVRIMNDQGTSQFLSEGPADLAWLKSKSYKHETRGNYTLFWVRYQE